MEFGRVCVHVEMSVLGTLYGAQGNITSEIAFITVLERGETVTAVREPRCRAAEDTLYIMVPLSA